MPLTRREILTTAAALPAAGVLQASSASASQASEATSYKTIDFRVRPPFRSFRGHRPNDPGDERLMERFLAEMDRANIGIGVAMGRTASAEPFRQFVPNEDIGALVERYPDRFLGFGSVDVRHPQDAVREVARCAAMGLRGIAFDNPLSDPPLYNDDTSLMPIYEACAKHGLIIALNASGAIGPDLSYSNPVLVQKVAHAFPTHPIVVSHGAWPYTREMVAIALYGMMLRNANVYFQIDYALLGDTPLPGAGDYVDAANLESMGNGVELFRKALFGSSYPAIDLKDATDRFARLPIRNPAARKAILRDNAAGLLKIEP